MLLTRILVAVQLVMCHVFLVSVFLVTTRNNCKPGPTCFLDWWDFIAAYLYVDYTLNTSIRINLLLNPHERTGREHRLSMELILLLYHSGAQGADMVRTVMQDYMSNTSYSASRDRIQHTYTYTLISTGNYERYNWLNPYLSPRTARWYLLCGYR